MYMSAEVQNQLVIVLFECVHAKQLSYRLHAVVFEPMYLAGLELICKDFVTEGELPVPSVSKREKLAFR